MTTLPKALQYQNLKPKGIYSKFKRWTIQPQTSFKQYSQNEIIRFQFQTNDFIDPYQSYLEMEVEFDPDDYVNLNGNFDPFGESGDPNKYERCDARPTFHLDGPSTSLIQELILYSNHREIERVQEYDQIGYLLADLNTQLGCRLFKAFEGYHYERAPSNKQTSEVVDNRSVVGIQRFRSAGLGADTTYHAPQFNSMMYMNVPLCTQQLYTSLNGVPSVFQHQYLSGIDIGTGNFNYDSASLLQNSAYLQRLGVLRHSSNQNASESLQFTQIESFHKSPFSGFIDPTLPLPNNRMFVDEYPKTNYALQNIQNDASFGVSSEDSQYGGLYGQLQLQTHTGSNTADMVLPKYTDAHSHVKSSSFTGYHRPFSGGSAYNKTQAISPFIPHQNIVNGQFVTNQYTPGWNKGVQTTVEKQFTTTKKKFYIPILSGVIGQLIPRDEWRLIPGKGLGELLFEWKVNPYAFFASGVNFSKRDLQDQQSMYETQSDNYQFPMRWKISKIEMHFDLWMFDDIVHNQINQLLRGEGIMFTSQGFSQGPKYQISNTQNVRNNWHINNGIKSARGIYFWFLDDRYQQYSTCRKQYRLSHNLKYMQLKVGQDYLPQTPIKGNAGCIGMNKSISSDLTEFYCELQRCTGSFFDCEKPLQITQEQFAVNNRPYDPANLAHVYGQNALFHEERCRGQALYGFDLMSDPKDNSVLSGLNTNDVKPIELMLDINSGGDFDKSSTMYIFLHHDFLVRFRDGEITTAGAG